jgi:hypothetical protein
MASVTKEDGSVTLETAPATNDDDGIILETEQSVGLILTDVQRYEIESQTCLISRPDRGRQPTDDCGPLSHCAYTKDGEGLGAQTMKFAVTYLSLPYHPRTDH